MPTWPSLVVNRYIGSRKTAHVPTALKLCTTVEAQSWDQRPKKSAAFGKGVLVKFEGNTGSLNCYSDDLSANRGADFAFPCGQQGSTFNQGSVATWIGASVICIVAFGIIMKSRRQLRNLTTTGSQPTIDITKRFMVRRPFPQQTATHDSLAHVYDAA